jgi:hypothetical protein
LLSLPLLRPGSMLVVSDPQSLALAQQSWTTNHQAPAHLHSNRVRLAQASIIAAFCAARGGSSAPGAHELDGRPQHATDISNVKRYP